MKLREGYVTHNVAGETIMVCIRTDTPRYLAKANETAAEIFAQLKEDVTQAQIVDALEAIYDAPREKLEQDTAAVLAKLREIGAIEE